MRRWIVSLMLLLLVTGCAPRGAQPTPPNDPVPPVPTHGQAPAEPAAQRRVVERHGPGLPAELTEVAIWPDGTVVVGSGPVTVRWMTTGVTGEPPVRSSGPAATDVTRGAGWVEARFSEAPLGSYQVWLEGIQSSRFTIERRPDPTVRIGYRIDGGALTMTEAPTLTLGGGRLTLELLFDQPMVEISIESAREQTRRQNPGFDFTGDTLSWVEERRAVWEFSRVPSQIELALPWFRSASGLPLRAEPLVVRHVDPEPFLERVDLATGKRERIMALPADIEELLLAPDGQALALRTRALHREPGKPDAYPATLWWVDLNARTVATVPISAWEIAWCLDGRLCSFGRGSWGELDGWESYHPAAGAVASPEKIRTATVSPDGRTAAFLNPPPMGLQGHTLDQVWPVPLVLADLATGSRRQMMADFVKGYWFAKGGDGRQWTAWHPQGRLVAALNRTAYIDGQIELVVFDLDRSERRVLLRSVDVYLYGTRLVWSPDGGKILARDRVIDLATGRVIDLSSGQVTLPGRGLGAGFWDLAGQRILIGEGEWGDVLLFGLGEVAPVNLGAGRPVGWAGPDAVYVIRWAGSDRRLVVPPY